MLFLRGSFCDDTLIDGECVAHLLKVKDVVTW